MRVNTLEDIKMPPLAHNVLDAQGAQVLQQWIQTLPGRRVVPPPRISPASGNYDKPIDVTLTEPEPGATIRYTVDGSLPTASDLLYERPIHLTGPTILRARAFKSDFHKSIIAQQVFVIGG